MGDADAHADACGTPLAWRHAFGHGFIRRQQERARAPVSEIPALLDVYLNNPLPAVARARLLAAIRRRHGAALLDQAIHGLARRFPELSAQQVLSRPQAIAGILLGLMLLMAFVLSPSRTWLSMVWLLSLVFGLNGAFRTLLAVMAPRVVSAAPPGDMALPTYTLLVPLYREAAVLPALVDSLLKLDYPRALLDIKLVVEEDDAQTVAVAHAQAARDGALEVIEVPVGGPRTKPKAANYALAFARGEYLVVYDAEDRPEPDQLKKSVATFRAGPRTTACLQARLHIHNGGHNWLVGMAALDYELWFGKLLPGLDRINAPMPLGGTSNHFRTAVLREIGGWDAFNVTEDADIGIRLSQLGYRVSMLDSVTFEEGPITVDAWLGQRSRWLKGHMQTWLVHMRRPLTLMRRTGLAGFSPSRYSWAAA
jgi:cellulose synthase/poly-beta-1,6-N-acetylglucosamine synthase-like glycosyltransferase